MIPIIGPIFELGGVIAKGVINGQKAKQNLKAANTNSRIRMAESRQNYNQTWELRSLENAGWKDDILFYALIGMYVFAGFFPDQAALFFNNLNLMP